MRERDLAVVVLQKIAVSALQNAGRTAGEARGVLAQFGLRPPASTPISFTPASSPRTVEHADGVAAAADAGENRIGQAAFALQNLRARFDADHAMKIAHHHG
jgi:hypothetical protein